LSIFRYSDVPVGAGSYAFLPATSTAAKGGRREQSALGPSISKWSYVYCAANQFILLLEYLFNLADFLLDFAGDFFVLAFGFQVGVVRDLSGCLFDVAFQFMKLALDLIFLAQFHRVFLFSFENFPLKLFPVFGAVA
jgi:hypothetical protein